MANKKTLFERLGGEFGIAYVVNRFSNQVLENKTVGYESKNQQLQDWSVHEAKHRLPGLKFERTLWMIDATGGPLKYVPSLGLPTNPTEDRLSLEIPHCPLQITSDEFDAVAGELDLALLFCGVPQAETKEVLAAFNAEKNKVIRGSKIQEKGRCPYSLPERNQANKARTDTLFERLGGEFGIAYVVELFSDRLLQDQVVGVNSKNPHLRNWSRNEAEKRLPGLKFERTLWMIDATGGPLRYTPSLGVPPLQNGKHLNLANPHCPFQISRTEFDAVAGVLKTVLEECQVPKADVQAVLDVFGQQKDNVTMGNRVPSRCPAGFFGHS